MYIRPSVSSKPQQTPLSTGSHPSVGAGVGGAVGGAVVLLLAMSVLGAGLLIVWRRRNTSKLVQQPVPVNRTAAHFDNPVYGGKWEGRCKHSISCIHGLQAMLCQGILIMAMEFTATSPHSSNMIALCMSHLVLNMSQLPLLIGQ